MKNQSPTSDQEHESWGSTGAAGITERLIQGRKQRTNLSSLSCASSEYHKQERIGKTEDYI